MRMLLFSLLSLQCLFGDVCCAVTPKYREETLIRRAYLDVLGLVPTIDEIDWYLTYNTNGYQLAVEFLLTRNTKRWNIDNKIGRILLNSKEYRELSPRKLDKADLDRCVLYIVGDLKSEPITDNALTKSISKLITLSENITSDPLDRIDFMCSNLMSRTTSTDEANMLLQVFNSNSKLYSEDIAWTIVVSEILQMPDVCCK